MIKREPIIAKVRKSEKNGAKVSKNEVKSAKLSKKKKNAKVCQRCYMGSYWKNTGVCIFYPILPCTLSLLSTTGPGELNEPSWNWAILITELYNYGSRGSRIQSNSGPS